jgi:hypothetical protein
MDLNGNGITVSKAVWEEMLAANPALAASPTPRPVKADAL